MLVPGAPKDCSGRIAPLESLLRLPDDLGGSFRREVHCTRRAQDRQRTLYENSDEACPGAGADIESTAVPPPARGYPQRDTLSSPATQNRQGSSVATRMPIR